jgi:hypothetical protein
VGLAHRVCTEPQLSPVQSWEEICPFGQSRSAWAGADVSSAAAIPRIPTNQRTDTNERIAKCYGLSVNLWLLSASWCSPLTARRWCDRDIFNTCGSAIWGGLRSRGLRVRHEVAGVMSWGRSSRLPFVERGSGAHQRDLVSCVDRPPAGLGSIDQLVCHGNSRLPVSRDPW